MAWANVWSANLDRLFKSGNIKEAWKRIRNLKCKPHSNENLPINALLTHFTELFGQKDEWKVGAREIPVVPDVIFELDCSINRSEVVKVLKELRNGKAGGVDGICPELFKNIIGKNAFVTNIHHLFSKIFEDGKVPTIWGREMIQSLYKGNGPKVDPNSYRAITLLPVLGKCYTKLLTNRINTWTEKYGRLSENQCGFKRGFSTIDNVFVLRSLIDRQLGKKRGKLYCCFVDLKKAFDSISREALWYKLKVKGMSTKMLHRIQAVYKEVSFCVKDREGKVTKDIKQLSGVRQGCQMSPVLFNLFIDDIVDYLAKIDTHPPYLKDKPVNILLYADDMVLISLSPIGLQRALNSLYDYCKEWQIGINISKTKAMIFQNGCKESKKLKWTIRKETIETVNTFKYLGIVLHKNGKWKKHQVESSKKAEVAGIIVGKTRLQFKNISLKLLNKMFDTLVQPVVLYGAEIWGDKCESKVVDGPGIAHCKRILGVGHKAANVGVVLEAGRVMTSTLAGERLLSYWMKLVSDQKKTLQLDCLNMQIGNRNSNNWIEGVRNWLNKIGMIHLLGQRNFSIKTIKIVKERLRFHCYTEMKEEAVGKKSLKLMNSQGVDRTGAAYIYRVGAEQRSLIARYRLGTWLWQCRKDEDGFRVCEFCGEREDGSHAFNQCTSLPTINNLLHEDFKQFLKSFFITLDAAHKARSANAVQ